MKILSLVNMLHGFDTKYGLLETLAEIPNPVECKVVEQLSCYNNTEETAADYYYQPSLHLFDGSTLAKKKLVGFTKQLECKYAYTTFASLQKRLI